VFTVVALLLIASAAAPARHADGFRGVWYMNQPQADEFKYKYSGGLGTYPQQHVPIAVYSPKSNKTFFTFGGSTGMPKGLLNLVSYYDHTTGEVANPVVLMERPTNDAHCNSTLALDDAGHVYVFCNAHGTGAQAYVFRSREPYSIDAFDVVREQNFSYSQVWPVEGRGLLWLHTLYKDGRRRVFASADMGPARQLLDIGMGSYAVSWSDGRRVAMVADFHPKPGGLNARTNIYYLETRDFGQTWTNVRGDVLTLPLTEPQNPALVHDFAGEKLLVYLKDLAFDADGRPVILYLTATSYKSGPAGGPRAWHTARWTGTEWLRREIVPADHNYDHGSLYIESDGVWRVIAPTAPGPQPHSTGGQIEVQLSRDQGMKWEKVQTLPTQSGWNQTYVRRPLNAHPDFYALWADGNALEPSESDLFFCTKAGVVFRLPREMTGDRAKPQPVAREKD
jgi:hypothetical protein